MLDESIMWHVTARRYNLDIFSCDVHFKAVFPKDRSQRTALYNFYYQQPLALPVNYDVYSRPAAKLSSIPLPCQTYVQVGCAFVKNVQVTLQSKADWAAYINRSGQTAPKLVHFIRA